MYKEKCPSLYLLLYFSFSFILNVCSLTCTLPLQYMGFSAIANYAVIYPTEQANYHYSMLIMHYRVFLALLVRTHAIP